eukprot:2852116-Amphidinium_carterae.1
MLSRNFVQCCKEANSVRDPFSWIYASCDVAHGQPDIDHNKRDYRGGRQCNLHQDRLKKQSEQIKITNEHNQLATQKP